MAGEMFVAKENTSQEILSKLENVVSDVSSVKSFVGGTKYKTITYGGTSSSISPSTNAIVLDVTGEGFVESLYLVGGGGNKFVVDIIVDGVVINKSGTTGGGDINIATKENMFNTYDGTTVSHKFRTIMTDGKLSFRTPTITTILPFDNTNANICGITILQQPIYFKESFQIKFYNTHSSTNTLTYSLIGALKYQ